MPVRGEGKTLAAGSQVISGVVRRGAFVRVLRGRNAVATGQIRGIRVHDERVREVQAGMECAVTVEPPFDFEAGDVLEVFELTEESASPPTTWR
jgi:translation initiation factor IF-2